MNRIKMGWRNRAEKVRMWIADHIPLRILYFAVIRATNIATGSPEYGNREVPAITAMEVALRLEKIIDPPKEAVSMSGFEGRQ